ncbi:hypothetical protein [Thermus phage P23-45]|uniref:Uncharacterized protein n=2 Tax=Oshimavirus TaxID=1623293 RepID=A7XX76_BP234|nr:hypothetical protein P23p49 [Thermus phage P23-45]YP_001468017.1 hypothetical protein P74p47 [Thermus phage P74-26]ABU96882.1 hypothetical protein P23p49 [Thermus phage P23-45]ABU96997.1 hypothetical protein P74p47 [Thermus phage P74-26]UYB98425.1 hypothetical protein [Thermus phage P23-45]
MVHVAPASLLVRAEAELAGAFHRGVHIDSLTVVDKPLYGWYRVRGELTPHGLKVVHLEDFPPGANPLRRAKLIGRPRLKLYDDGYELSLEAYFGGLTAYVWSKPLIASLLEAKGLVWLEGRLYDGRVIVDRGGEYV